MIFGEPNIDRTGERGGQRAQQEMLSDLKEKMGSQYYLSILRKLANTEPLDEGEQALIHSLRDNLKQYH